LNFTHALQVYTSLRTNSLLKMPSKQDVSDKFSELHNKYYVNRGYMISTVNDNVAKKFVEDHPEITWIFGYNKYAEANIQTAKINVKIFGKMFTVLLERPMYPVERSEFECYFGFGGHCEGFTPYRMIMRFATTIEEHGFDFQTLLHCDHLEENSKEKIEADVNISYIQDVFKLLVIGGYVKYWKAWDELSQWFLENIEDESIRTWLQTESLREKSEKNCLSTINKYVFQMFPATQV
jgi:hypothetical protein